MSSRSSALRARVEPELLEALDAARTTEARPGERLSRSDVARIYLWEMLRQRGIVRGVSVDQPAA